MSEIILAIIIAAILYISYSKLKAPKIAGPKVGELRIIKRADFYYAQVFGEGHGSYLGEWACIGKNGDTWPYDIASRSEHSKYDSEESAGKALNNYARIHQGETTLVWSQNTTSS